MTATAAASARTSIRGWIRPASSATTLAFGACVVGLAIGALAPFAPAPALLGLLLLPIVLALLLHPEWATLLAVGLTWASLPDVLVQKHGLPTPVTAMVLPVLVLAVMGQVRNGRSMKVDRLNLWLLAFGGAILLSTIPSAHHGVAVTRLFKFTTQGLLAYFLLTHAVGSVTTLRRVIWTLVGVTSVLCLFSLFQKFSGNYYHPFFGFAQIDPGSFYGYSKASPRVSGPFGDPNYYSQMLVASIPLAAVLLGSEKSRGRRFFLGTSIAMMVFVIMLTASRGAAMALLVVVAYLLLRRRLKLRTVVLAVPLAALAVGVLAPQYVSRLSTLFGGSSATTSDAQVSQTSDLESSAARATEMRAAALVLLDHPLIGVGPGEFPIYYQSYASRAGGEVHQVVRWGPQKGQLPQRQAHDMLLSIAAELGVVGLIVFVGLLLSAFAGLRRARRRARSREPELAALADAVIASLIAYVVAGVFLTLAFERYLWLLVALAGVVIELSKRGAARVRDDEHAAQSEPRPELRSPILVGADA
jgi:putative inorganic carbon (hco3(-)) transporter